MRQLYVQYFMRFLKWIHVVQHAMSWIRAPNPAAQAHISVSGLRCPWKEIIRACTFLHIRFCEAVFRWHRHYRGGYSSKTSALPWGERSAAAVATRVAWWWQSHYMKPMILSKMHAMTHLVFMAHCQEQKCRNPCISSQVHGSQRLSVSAPCIRRSVLREFNASAESM